ncbi:hypothetical protein M8C21_012479, partial [Ambrosia artemisiifolia]
VFRCISIVTTYDYVDSLRATQELADEKLSLSNTMSKLKYQLEYEKKRDILYNLVQKYASSTEKQRDNIAITDSLSNLRRIPLSLYCSSPFIKFSRMIHVIYVSDLHSYEMQHKKIGSKIMMGLCVVMNPYM